MEINHEQVVEAIQRLVTAQHHGKSRQASGVSVSHILEINISRVKESIEVLPGFVEIINQMPYKITDLYESDVRWCFVVWNLRLLKVLTCLLKQAAAKDDVKSTVSHDKSSAHLNSEIQAPQLSSAVLSITHQKTVATAFQFVVGLGICPYLLPGVGVPFERRSEVAQLFVSDSNSADVDSYVKESRLSICINVLLECYRQPVLGSILLSKHLGDLLAVLLQLCHLQKQKASSSTVDCATETSDGKDMPKLSMCDNPHEELVNLVRGVHPPMLVKELLLLQSGCPPIPGVKAKILKPPVWLRKRCQLFLCETVVKPQGVLAVVCSILQDVGGNAVDTRKCDAAARIIVDCCKSDSLAEQHFSELAPQILELFHGPANAQLLRVAVCITSYMFCHNRDLTLKLIMHPLLLPLQSCLQSSGLPDGADAISEDALTSCIDIIHKVCVLNCEPDSPLILTLLPYTHVLYALFCGAHQSVSFLRTAVQEVLQRLLSTLDVVSGVACLYQLSSLGTDCALFKPMHTGLTFVSGESGGMKAIAVTAERDDLELCIESAENIGYLVTILHGQDQLIAEFFLSCLKELTDTVSSDLVSDELLTAGSRDNDSQCLLDIEARLTLATNTLKHNLSLLGVIGALCERLDFDCFKNTEHIIRFAQVTLERVVKTLNQSTDPMFAGFEDETLLMALGLLSALLSYQQKGKELNWSAMDGILPLLQHIASTHPDTAVRDMAMDIQVTIASHGRVKYETPQNENSSRSANIQQSSSSGSIADNLKNKNRPLIEVLDIPESAAANKDSETQEADKCSGPNSQPCFQSAKQDLCSSLVPVRGHALIVLRQLVDSADSETLSAKDDLLQICQENINDEDSYIYLTTVRLLSSLAVRFPQEFLPWLVNEYAQPTSDNSSNSKVHRRSAERTMKLGEVLVKTSAALGPFVPHFRDLLLSACLRTARDPDPLICASAVSNLGQVCQNLHFSLGGVMYEVFECIQSLLKSHQAVEVRRSAAMCSTLLLRGLSKDSLKVLGGSLMRDFYQLLKYTSTMDKDDVVRLHAQLAREEVDNFMKDFVFPTQTLTKRIHVVDPLDVD